MEGRRGGLKYDGHAFLFSFLSSSSSSSSSLSSSSSPPPP